MKYYLVILISFIVLPCFGQQFYFREEPSLVEENVRQIHLLFQSADEMVWMGTDKGLFAYDGRQYNHRLRSDDQTLKVTVIAESPGGHIWAGYEDGFIQSVTLQGINEAIPSDSLKGTAISKILFTSSSLVYIATYGKGIWKMDDGHFSKLRDGRLSDLEDIYDALIDAKGRVWLATDNGIWLYDPTGGKDLIHINRSNGLPDEIVTQLEQDDNGDIWIGLYDHGLAKYHVFNDSVTLVMSPELMTGAITGLCKGQAGEVWYASAKAIGRYSAKDHGRNIRLPFDKDQRVQTMMLDQNGLLWVAADNKIFTANTRFEFRKPNIEGIQAIEIAADKIWIGGEMGLFALDPSNGNHIPYLSEKKINVLCLFADPEERLWIGTFGQGLYCLDPVSGRVLHLTEADSLSNNSILNIDGRDNTIWLATLGGITQLHWNEDPYTEKIQIDGFREKYNFPEGYVYDVYVAEDGHVWFGTDGQGLYVLKQDQWLPFNIPLQTAKEQLEDLKTVYSITSGPDHSIWVSGSHGQIVQLDKNGSILRFIKGYEGDIHSLITSGAEEIIVLKTGGIQLINQRNEMITFGENAGMKSFSPNINAAVRDEDGSVWIADASGIWHYMPQVSDTGRQVRIHLVEATPSSLYQEEGAKVKSDSNYLDIRFTGLWYQDPGNVRYRYMLEGHDQDWIYTREGRAVYSRLAPGTYTFKVDGSHHDDFSHARTFSRTFVVLPPFYLRWWFVLSLSFLLAWLIFTYVFSRIKRIKKLHQLEKEKAMLRLHAIQAQVNPHFLFNSFNTLAGIIEEDQHAAVDYVDQLSGFFRAVLMHRNAELIRVDEELQLVRNYTFILQKRYGSNLILEEDILQVAGWIAPLSIQLLVENAIKHNIVSSEKPLKIRITVHKDYVTVSNPRQSKFNEAVESTGFGLSSLLARYQYLTRERIVIQDTTDTFSVTIPVIYTDKTV